MHAVASLFPTVAKTVTRKTEVDPEFLRVEHATPPPMQRAAVDGKYHKQFSIMRPGSCIRCEPAEMNAVAIALRNQIKRGRYPALKGCSVRASQRCEDGAARVWALII